MRASIEFFYKGGRPVGFHKSFTLSVDSVGAVWQHFANGEYKKADNIYAEISGHFEMNGGDLTS